MLYLSRILCGKNQVAGLASNGFYGPQRACICYSQELILCGKNQVAGLASNGFYLTDSTSSSKKMFGPRISWVPGEFTIVSADQSLQYVK